MTRAVEHPGAPDTERFRLRRFLETLPATELERVGPADLIDVAASLEGNPRAVLFESAGAAPGAIGLSALHTTGQARTGRP